MNVCGKPLRFPAFVDYPKLAYSDFVDALSYAHKSMWGTQPKPQEQVIEMKHIVLNDKAQVMSPSGNNYPESKPQLSLSFETQAEAKGFAEFLAGKYRDQGFHVFSAVGTAKTEQPPVRWRKAGTK